MSFDFSIAEFRRLCATGLLSAAPSSWNRSDDDMNMRARLIPESIVPKPASVLVGIIDRANGPALLLTQRTAHLKSHAGQIAFPGGRMDEGETALDAALREAEEETGLGCSFVEPLGYLDGYLTITGFCVTPVVAVIHEGFTIKPQVSEVQDVFEVPLSFLMTVDNLRLDTREFKGVKRQYFVYPYKERYIWGATAGMLKNLYDRLYAQT